jgi:hypothetical protein
MRRHALGGRLARLTVGAVAVVAAAGAGCGGRNDPAFTDHPAPPASEFPPARDRTLEQIVRSAEPAEDLVVAPTQSVFQVGSNRFGFGVFRVDGAQVPDARAAVYAAPHGGGPVRGPFPARVEDLQTAPAFRSQTVALDPDAAKGLYVADVMFTRDGSWDVVALIRDGDRLRWALTPTVRVGGSDRIPAAGDPAPKIHTPTVSSVAGDVSAIDTRAPHDDMHEVDFADVVGRKPVVLLFATPALCQSRVCGPVVDEEAEAKSRYGDEVAFIHMEVFNDNNASDGLRPQLKAFGLRTEPWLFVIDRNGIVRARIEGAFGPSELDAAIQRVLR